MPDYYVNTNPQPTGEHEVHQKHCSHPALDIHKHQLGSFTNCFDAVLAARKIYGNVDGCAYCCPICHTK